MAEIFYFSVNDKAASDDNRMFEIPIGDVVRLFDLRPSQRECALGEFPNLLTGDPFVDSGGYIHVLLRLSDEEAEETGGYRSGWYKLNMTVIQVQSTIAEARKKARQHAPAAPKK